MPNTVMRGMSGQDVQELKAILTSIGYSLSEGDLFDLGTEAAVRAYQGIKRLEKDGIVGPRTWGFLQESAKENKGVFYTPKSPILWITPVDYLSQRDNVYSPGGTCNVTCLAMVMSYWGQQPLIKGAQLEDELFERLQQQDAIDYFNRCFPELAQMGYKPRHIHGMLTWLAKQYGYDAGYSEGYPYELMNQFGREHGPMILSGTFTPFGHIVTLVGATISGDLIVHDPWGDWNTGYRDQNGAYKIYNLEPMKKILSGISRTHKRVHKIRAD